MADVASKMAGTHTEDGTGPPGARMSERNAVSSVVVFDKVSFAFDDHVVLRDISLPSRREARTSSSARAAAGSPSYSSSFSDCFDPTLARFSSTVSVSII